MQANLSIGEQFKRSRDIYAERLFAQAAAVAAIVVVLVVVLVLERALFAPRSSLGLEPGGEPLWFVAKPTREIHPSMCAA